MSNSERGLAQDHQEVVDAVQAVAEETESTILAAGRTVALVVERVNATLEQVKTLGGRNGEGESEISKLLIEQREFTHRYLEAFTASLKEVARVSAMATKLMAVVSSGASNFAQLVRAGDFLSLYAKMEMARLPPGFAESSSFAQDFRNLAQNVRDISERVMSIVAIMLETLPEIDALVRELAVESRRVTNQMEKQSLHVRELAEALDRSLKVIYRLGEDRLPAIVERAHKALSNLQFYDPLMQDLQSLDGLMAEFRTLASPTGERFEPLRFMRRLGDIQIEGNGDAASAKAPVIANAGEVTLF